MVEEPPITKSNKTSYESLFGLFLIGCAPVLLLRHSLFSPEIFYYRDFWQLVYPNLKWGLSTLNTGHFPLWNPYIASGFPIFAGMLHGFAYPPLFLLLPFFPSSFEITLKFFILFHFLWAGAGLYLLCRYWKLAPLPSALGGLIFMLSGPFISGLNNLAYLVSPSWIPWALLCYAKSHENRNWLPVTAIVMALMALSGEIQTCYNTGLIFVLFSLCHFKKSIPLYSQYFTSFKNLSIIVILALLLAAIQIFPSFELAAHSERLTGASEEDSLFFSLYLEDLVRFFVPYIYGNPTDIWYGRAEIWPGRTVYHHAPFESSIYIGLLTLPLCLAGCFSKKVRNSKYFLISGFLFFFLTSFGAEIPFYTFLRDIHLPLWSSFRYSEKLILPAIFFASLLAAFGLEQLLSLSEKRKLIFTIATSILLLLILIGLFSKIPAFGSTDPHLNRVAAEYRSTQFLSSIFFCLLGILALLLLNLKKVSSAIFCLICCIIIFSDLIYHHQQIIPTVEKEFYQTCPEALAPYTQRENYRVSVLDTDHLPLALAYPIKPFVRLHRYCGVGNLSSNFGVMQDWGITPTMIESYSFLRRSILDFYFNRPHPNPAHPENPHNILLNRLAVKRVIFKVLIPGEQSPFFYEISTPRPRFSLNYNQIVFTKTKQEALKEMLRATSEKVIMLEEDLHPPPLQMSSENREDRKFQSIRIQSETSPNRLSLQIETAAPAYLLVADAYYPGWRAYVNGKSVEIYRADLAFRLIHVPKGKHRILFQYQPLSFYLGLFFTLLTSGFLIFWFRKTRRQQG